ncbi:MAG: hypothetical protein AAGF49_05630 [Pseudomonadota bacterium]
MATVKIALGLAAMVAFAASSATAQDADSAEGSDPEAPVQEEFFMALPDMVGTWTGTTESVISGNPRHFGSTEGDGTRTASTEATLTITNQEGGVFWGTFASPTASEKWLGALWGDGTGFRAVDTDGYAEGRFIDEDAFEICYTHTGGETMVASCVVMERE